MKYLVLIGVLTTVLSGCSKESLNVPDSGRRIVVNSLISTNRYFGVMITRSSYITDYNDSAIYNPMEYVKNAKVLVYQNGTLADSLHNITLLDIILNKPGYLELFEYCNYYSKHLVPEPGKCYEIRMNVPGLPDATASTKIPTCVNIDNVDTTIVYTDFNFADWPLFQNIIIHVSFTDPASEKNYYLFKLYLRQQSWDTRIPADFYCKDPVVEEKLSSRSSVSLHGLAFTDKLFNGHNYTLNISYPGRCIKDSLSTECESTIYLHLYSITEEYFRYIQACNLYKTNIEKAFFDPVLIPSNVSGGLGFFSGASVAIDSINICDYPAVNSK